jgi:hypothetical protein
LETKETRLEYLTWRPDLTRLETTQRQKQETRLEDRNFGDCLLEVAGRSSMGAACMRGMRRRRRGFFSVLVLCVCSKRTRCGLRVAISYTPPSSASLCSSSTKTWALVRSADLWARGLVSILILVIDMVLLRLHTTPPPHPTPLLLPSCCTLLCRGEIDGALFVLPNPLWC